MYIQVNMVGKPCFYGKKINTFAAFLWRKCNLNKRHQDALSLSKLDMIKHEEFSSRILKIIKRIFQQRFIFSILFLCEHTTLEAFCKILCYFLHASYYSHPDSTLLAIFTPQRFYRFFITFLQWNVWNTHSSIPATPQPQVSREKTPAAVL